METTIQDIEEYKNELKKHQFQLEQICSQLEDEIAAEKLTSLPN